MKLSGQATVHAAVADVYTALVDPAILVRIIPGCQRLERVDAETYRATVLAGVGSIQGAFAGQVRLTDRLAPRALTLHAEGAGAPGTVSAMATVTLDDVDGATEVRYDAEATIGGVIGGVGQRMIAAAARRTAGEFFAALDRELSGAGIGAGVVPGPADVVTSAVAAPGVAGGDTVTAGTAGQVWHAPARAADLARQRVRDVLTGAAFGAAVALLGVLVGAIVVGWS